ncbi:MAG: 30S ribosomal protein S8 [Chloroflexi bacterium]|mgnify:CR=1 FL=1|nr:30S ribosomal protein S8 [Chloroflexota bacterium]
MIVTDPVADMLTRIRNAMAVRHRYALVPVSKLKLELARVMAEEGFVESFDVTKDRPQAMIRLWLKYTDEKDPVVMGLRRVSKPGQRIYAQKADVPWVMSGLGVAVLSTSKGVMTDRQARRLGVGGEVLCYIW